MTTYEQFIRGKHVAPSYCGFDVDLITGGAKSLFDFQWWTVRKTAQWGRAAIFAECGLGKTGMQCVWADAAVRRLNKPTLILAPLAVAKQTADEAAEFGVHVQQVRSSGDLRGAGVYVTNYDRLDKFDPSVFGAVVLDESSILKNFSGKTKNALEAAFAHTSYRLCCTATPAPNDYMELGNHAQFLGVMKSSEMLSRWFINDTMNAGGYRLKGHARDAFWRWVASWAVTMDKPSDIGFSDDGWILPPLRFHEHVVSVDQTVGANDHDEEQLRIFREVKVSATSIHREKRLTVQSRADRVADLVSQHSSEPWVIWCDTNEEAEAAAMRCDAVEVRGSMSIERKEELLNGFTRGEITRLVTKPSIAGFGLNWQHCHNTAFIGLSYSFEALYQAVRRFYRFGQAKPVDAHLIVAETEGKVLEAIQRKQRQHEEMRAGMISAATGEKANNISGYIPHSNMEIPKWLA